MNLFPDLLPAQARAWPRAFVAVASADHVARGQAGGFAQACHGKRGPLARARPGDVVIYYAPTHHFGQGDKLQAFVAYGHFVGQVYEADMGAFKPHRRDVAWAPATPAPIAPLLPRLSFTQGPNWGAAFRWGFFQIPEEDRQILAEAMGLAHLRHDLSQEWRPSAAKS